MSQENFKLNRKEPESEIEQPIEMAQKTKDRIIGVLNRALDEGENTPDFDSEQLTNSDLREIAEHAGAELKEVLSEKKIKEWKKKMRLKQGASLEKVLSTYRELYILLPHSKEWKPPKDDRELLTLLIKRFSLPEDQNS